MDKNFTTSNSIIRFIYNDISLEERETLSYQMNRDYSLRAEYEMLKEAKQILPKVQFDPSVSVLNKILSYSRETATEPQC